MRACYATARAVQQRLGLSRQEYRSLPVAVRAREMEIQRALGESPSTQDPTTAIDPNQLRFLEEDAPDFIEADEKNARKDEGYIYVVTDTTDPEWVKIGTTRNLKRRLQQYNNSRVPRWEMHHSIIVPFRWAFEEDLIFHLEMEGFAKERREFFRCTVADAIRVLQSIQIRD